MSITYQQAKRIRKSSLSGLIADQLLYERKVGTAIKKAVSLKTRGTIMGITQKFDPLNIVKFLTFGSSLGPALLGNLTGRDPRDIQYFTGRLKPIRENTASRIGRMPSGISEDGDLNPTLKKIFKLMKSVQEEEIRRLELSQNQEEERELEAQRRHKELLEALTGRKTTTTTKITPVKKEGDNLFDSIAGMISSAISKVKDWVGSFLESFDFLKVLGKIFGGAQIFASLLRFLGLPIFGVLLGAATILGLAELLRKYVSTVSNTDVRTPEEAAAALENGSSYDIEKLGGREKLEDTIVNGPKRAEDILQRGDPVEIANAGGAEFLQKVKSQTNIVVPKTTFDEIKVPPRPDTTGGKNKARAMTWDNKFGRDFNFDGTKKTPEDSVNSAEMKKLTRQNISTTGVPVDNSENVGSKLNTVVNENMSNRLATGVLVKKAPSETTQTNITKSVQTVPEKKPIPSVRNHEESFSRMIFESTRVV